ncbi:MAG: RNA polymerase sigma factor [Acidiferrobacterales bacterium]
MAGLLLGTLGNDAIVDDHTPETVADHRHAHATRVLTVERAPAEGDPMTAFLSSVERRAYRIAQSALWDHELALDIVQDSMLKLVERYREKPVAEWPALFFTILRNRINDARRQRRIREGFGKIISLFGHSENRESQEEGDLLEFGLGVDLTQSADRPEDILAARRIRDSITAAVRQLPQRQRQVFLLRESQELSVRETSQILGCSEGTVKQHHFRAMQALRHLLAEVWNHE